METIPSYPSEDLQANGKYLTYKEWKPVVIALIHSRHSFKSIVSTLPIRNGNLIECKEESMS